MRLAVREVNTNGGVGAGRKLAMVVCDYGGADGVAEGAEQAALIEGGVDLLGARLSAPVIIAGSSSAVTQQALDRILTRRYPVAFVSSFSTSTQLTKYPDKLSPDDPVGLLWRTAPDDSAQADVLGRLIDAEPGISKLAIVYVDDAYGAPLQQGVKVALGALGSSMATSVHPFGDGTDFATLMAEVFDQAAPPDAMLFIGVDGHQVVEAYQALVDSGHAPAIHAHFLADAAKDKTTLFDPTLPSAVRDIIRSAKGTAPFHSTAPHYDTFAVNLETEFGVDAEGFSFLAHSYDAAYLAAYGLVWADASDRALDGVGVAEGFARLEDGEVLPVGRATWPAAVTALTTGSPADRQLDIDGTSGPLDFDPATGNAPGPIEIWRPDSALDHFQTCASCQPGDAACDLSACFEQ
jgi:ABC-type branched-subunit amino acid transport system substrate-binding protein